MLCPICGKSISKETEVVSLCDSCIEKNLIENKTTESTAEINPTNIESKESHSLEAAGFWLRVNATLVDNFIYYLLSFLLIFIVFCILGASVAFSLITNPIVSLFSGFIVIIIIFISFFFIVPPIFEASSMQGTIGKYLLGIMVIDKNGKKIGILRAFCRNIFRMISHILASLPFLTTIIHPEKKALHDILVNTQVVKFKNVSYLRILICALTPIISIAALCYCRILFEGPKTNIQEQQQNDDDLNEVINLMKDFSKVATRINEIKTSKNEGTITTEPLPKNSPIIEASPSTNISKESNIKGNALEDLPEFDRRVQQAKLIREGKLP